MQIGNPRIYVEPVGGAYRFTVGWDAEFTQAEVDNRFLFHEWITFKEWDTSDHDILGTSEAFELVPDRLAVPQEFSFVFTADELDTEIGGEEIRAHIYMRNVTTSSNFIEGHTHLVELSV